MEITGVGVLLVAVAAAFGTAAFALIGAMMLAARQQARAVSAAILGEARDTIAFLFDGEDLRDATPQGRALIDATPDGGSDWARLAARLRHRFLGFDAALSKLAESGRIELRTEDGQGDLLVAEWRSGLARIEIRTSEQEMSADDTQSDRLSVAALEAELETLRGISDNGPAAIWKQAADGTIIWANEVDFTLAADLLGPEAAHSWPPPAMFPVAPNGIIDGGGPAPALRAVLRPEDGRTPRWFDCFGYATGDQMLCYAVPANAVVQAEEALREFVQTLSKTFAHLPIGLAVFDRSRRLALFNPALTDLTALEVDFLAARPSLFAFLDKLRDRRMIPEPRDYKSWRQRTSDLEAAAAGGFVQENWTLPSGQTYRVTGRPHPDGAVAFLFEDISAEVSLTRRFRSELELGQ